MSTVNNGPQIVRSGLVLNLDASSVTSYSAISVYKVECYSTFGGGLRSANYTVQYSDDNSTWTTAFTGVMSNNSSCGIIAGTNRNDSNYSKHRYWRYVEGGAVVGHHPRVSRIDFITKSGAVYNLITYTTDNCADSGTYIVGTVSKDFGTTTWRDTSGNGNNGTFGASTAEPTYSNQNGGSLVFDGSNDYVNIPYNSILNSSTTFTVDFWFKSNNIATEQAFFSTTNTSLTSGYHIQVYVSKIILQVYPSQAYTFASQTLSSNTFYNVSVTYNSGNIIYYINGTSAGTANYIFTPSNIDVAIGKFTYNNSLYLNGNIPSFKFYNRALSAAEILQNYNATKTRFGL